MPCSSASRSTVSAASTTSPSGRASIAASPRPQSAGNDNTLVGASLPRQMRLRFRIALSSTRTSARSYTPCLVPAPARNAARAARERPWSLGAIRSQSVAFWSTSTSSLAPARSDPPLRLGLGSAITRDLLGRGLVGIDNLADELAADDIAAGEGDMGNVLDTIEDRDRLEQAGILAGGQIDLRWIAGHDHLALLAKPGQKHLHLNRRAILGLVEDDHGVGQGSPAHEGERGDLDHPGF